MCIEEMERSRNHFHASARLHVDYYGWARTVSECQDVRELGQLRTVVAAAVAIVAILRPSLSQRLRFDDFVIIVAVLLPKLMHVPATSSIISVPRKIQT